eukprot:Sspe_Gene.5710::Locus_1900_Transcript_1_1_Confidence_1.000_Length_1278::g.5710::m.5710/K15356/VRG4, GONST1; GDP-mannose transporter
MTSTQQRGVSPVPDRRPTSEAPKQEQGWQRLEIPISIAMYSTCSISMIILNKLVAQKVNFPLPLVFLQNLSATIVVILLKQIGIVTYPTLEKDTVRRWLPLTGLFIAMLTSSLISLRTMSVAIQTLIKNLAIISTALGDHYLFGHPLNLAIWISFIAMIGGSYIGAGSDKWITAMGLFWTLINAASTTTYQLYMKGVLNDLKRVMGKWGPVYYNNILSLPILLIPTLWSWAEWVPAVTNADRNTKVYIVLMLLVSAVMTMSSFWCMRATSPTTYGVIGGMNKIPLAIIGIYVFDQYPTTLGAIGITAALSGGLLYSYATNSANEALKKAAPQQNQFAPYSHAGFSAASAATPTNMVQRTMSPTVTEKGSMLL